MAERTKATVLKTVARKRRGFESLSLRQASPGRLSSPPKAATMNVKRSLWTSPLKFDKIRHEGM
jgi:hypothetical protein